jgi:hypothetical protein
VLWNANTEESSPGDVSMGEPAKGGAPAELQLEDRPADKDPVFPIGFFHTHPPAPKGYVKKGVGPSNKDKEFAKSNTLPGAVIDSMKVTSTCSDSGTYFFGPERRPNLSR